MNPAVVGKMILQVADKVEVQVKVEVVRSGRICFVEGARCCAERVSAYGDHAGKPDAARSSERGCKRKYKDIHVCRGVPIVRTWSLG